MCSGVRNESNNHLFAPLGEKKIFHELDPEHVQKLGFKHFWAHEAEMSLTALRSQESARTNFFMNTTQNMCKNLESNVFGLTRPK